MDCGGTPTLGKVSSLSIECGDCGRLRWRKPQELYRMKGIDAATPLADIGNRLVCSSCQEQGDPGKNIVIQAAFSFETDRIKAEAWRTNILGARAAG